MSAVDYMRDANASKYLLVEKIMEYYQDRGQAKGLKVWVETLSRPSGEKIFVVRSNIKFSIPSLYRKK